MRDPNTGEKIQPPDPNKHPDIAVHHPFFGECFLPPVPGVSYHWDESELDQTLYDWIDKALDLKRLDVVAQLSKHLEK